MLKPFVLGAEANLRRLEQALPALRVFGRAIEQRVAENPQQARFASLLQVANALEYEAGMGMPAWVMLDCGLLPSFFAGIAGPLSAVDPVRRDRWKARWKEAMEHRGRLENTGGPAFDPELRDDEIVPLSEFCALPAIAPGVIVAFSLYSLRPGLATAAKALGLALHRALGATRQIGVAQYGNLALRTHTRFGPLKILQAVTPAHTLSTSTFVYELAIPPRERLEEIAVTAISGRSRPETDRSLEPHASLVDAEDSATWRAFDHHIREGTHQYEIVSPGVVVEGSRKSVCVRRSKTYA